MTEPKKHPRRVRWLARGLIVALIALAVIYLRCGGAGLGFGGGGGGSAPVGLLKEPPPPTTPASSKDGEEPAASQDAGLLRCQLRLDSGGLWLLGATGQSQTDVASAVSSCKESGGADVVITGDARQGAWDELRAALDAAGVPSFVRGGGAPAAPGAQTAPVAPAGASGEPVDEASGGSNAR